MINLVIATAGHVDHGKSTLIKALTGIETDTTKEEKKRGLSINLGFAYLDLDDGQRVGIVDVPGHERFIKNMVAGLPGINLVLLVIDAGEGIMPQTREHVDILTLLGVSNFLIVLTKVDTVDEDMKELVIADIREQFSGTVLEQAELVETDAVSGTGMAALKQKIKDWARQHPQADEQGEARLNVDRVFSVKGFGTVVTGTLLDGPVAIGDDLTVYPSLKKTRVRNIQIHEQNVKRAGARHRTALNLANLGTEEIRRGDVLSTSPALPTTWMIDVKARCLASAPAAVGLWDRVRLLVGTREIMARTVPIGTDEIQPGSEGFLQLRLEEQAAVKEGDRFILRSYSPMRTIGGGEVLDAAPRKHRRFRADVLESLKTKEEGNIEEVTADFLLNKKDVFSAVADIRDYVRLPQAEMETVLEKLVQSGTVLKTQAGYIHQTAYKKLRGQALQILLTYHQKFPLRPGMAIEEFRSRLRKILGEKEISQLVLLMTEDRCCRISAHTVAAAKFHVVFTPEQERLRSEIERRVTASGFTPVKVDELLALHKEAGAVLDAVKGDTILFLTPEYVLACSVYDKAVAAIRGYIAEHGKMTLGDFRDMTASSRKSSMLILEYTDAENITRRVENYRILGE